MKASAYERELAQTNGVVIRYWARPVALEGHGDTLSGVVFERAQWRRGRVRAGGSVFRLEADMVFLAIGQRGAPEALEARRSRSRTAASSSTPSAARRLRACGPAAIASTAART